FLDIGVRITAESERRICRHADSTEKTSKRSFACLASIQNCPTIVTARRQAEKIVRYGPGKFWTLANDENVGFSERNRAGFVHFIPRNILNASHFFRSRNFDRDGARSRNRVARVLKVHFATERQGTS